MALVYSLRLTILVLACLAALIIVQGGCGDCYKEYSADGGTGTCPEASPLVNDAESCECSSGSSSGSGSGGGGWTLRPNPGLRQPDWRRRMTDKYYENRAMAEQQHRRLSTCSESSCCETQAERDKREEETTIGIAVGVSCAALLLLGLGYCFFTTKRGETGVAHATPIPTATKVG